MPSVNRSVKPASSVKRLSALLRAKSGETRQPAETRGDDPGEAELRALIDSFDDRLDKLNAGISDILRRLAS